jgi:hypothetical protein
MPAIQPRRGRWHPTRIGRRIAAAPACLGAALTMANCGSGNSSDNRCTPGDADSTSGGNARFDVNVSDTGFSVGGVDSGSTEPNITTENLATVTLTLTNVGTRPHDVVIGCLPSGLPTQCPLQVSCFPNPDDAGSTPGSVTLVPTVQPGASATVTFVTPVVEGAYPFISNEPGDDTSLNPVDDGGVTGSLAGEFVLM